MCDPDGLDEDEQAKSVQMTSMSPGRGGSGTPEEKLGEWLGANDGEALGEGLGDGRVDDELATKSRTMSLT
mgnify:CR=1 FL=1